MHPPDAFDLTRRYFFSVIPREACRSRGILSSRSIQSTHASPSGSGPKLPFSWGKGVRITAALAALTFTLAGAPRAFAAARPTLNQVSQGLTCQCGCGLTVANCNHPQCSFSVPLRGEIEAMISHGETRDQILTFYRHKFGEKILSAPTTEGFNLLAWTMPFVAIVVGGGFITLAFTRWRKAPAPSEKTPAASEPSAFDSDLRRRLENELKESR